MLTDSIVAFSVAFLMAGSLVPVFLLVRRLSGVAVPPVPGRPMAAITLTMVSAVAAAVGALPPAPSGPMGGIYCLAALAIFSSAWCLVVSCRIPVRRHPAFGRDPVLLGFLRYWTVGAAVVGFIIGCGAGTLVVPGVAPFVAPVDLLVSAVLGACAVGVGLAVRLGDGCLRGLGRA